MSNSVQKPVHCIKNDAGIALIQVLIISIILSMLGIYINQTIRSQVNVVNLMKNSFSLDLELENTEANLLHTLLTQKPYRKKNSTNVLVRKWNFYGKPFLLNENTTVIIQDLSGLLSLNTLNNTFATNFLKELGLSKDEARTFLDSLSDWRDKDNLKHLNGAESNYYHSVKKTGPRNGDLQTLAEVKYIKQGQSLTMAQWERYFTTEITSNFNPLNAPSLLLKNFLDNDAQYEEIIKQRESGTLTGYSFYQITSVEQDEYISFATGRLMKITIKVKGQNNKLSKQFIVDLRPRSLSRPIVISQITWNQV